MLTAGLHDLNTLVPVLLLLRLSMYLSVDVCSPHLASQQLVRLTDADDTFSRTQNNKLIRASKTAEFLHFIFALNGELLRNYF
jgi:hypothetical protein